MQPARLTKDQLAAMTIKDLMALHVSFDAQITDIRSYQLDIHNAITAAEQAAAQKPSSVQLPAAKPPTQVLGNIGGGAKT